MSKYDIDRAFDDTIKRSLPYLIFSPQEFRNKLAEQMDTLCQYYREKNDASFPGRNESINKMLDEAPEMDELTELKIHYFQSHQKRIEDHFWEIESRISKLEKNMKSKNTFHTKKQTPVEKETFAENKVHVEESKENIQQEPIMDPPLKPLKTREIVLNYLKSSTGSYSVKELSVNTGLTEPQVSNAIQRLKKNKGEIKWERRNTYLTDKNGISRQMPLIVYSWAGEESDEEESSWPSSS